MNIPAGALVILCGPSGSGKSTFALQQFSSTQVVSSDRLRAMVCDDESDQQASAAAFYLLRALVRLRMERGRLTVVDSTALRPKNRRDLLRIGKAQGAAVIGIVFDVDLETCRARNAGRGRRVPDDVIEEQGRLFQQALTTIDHEGFDVVYRVSGTELGATSPTDRA